MVSTTSLLQVLKYMIITLDIKPKIITLDIKLKIIIIKQEMLELFQITYGPILWNSLDNNVKFDKAL